MLSNRLGASETPAIAMSVACHVGRCYKMPALLIGAVGAGFISQPSVEGKGYPMGYSGI